MIIDVDVVSDAICPWCYIGKRRLEKAISRLAGRHEIRVHWKPYQLNPKMPPGGMDRRAYRLRKFGSEEVVRGLDRRVIETGREEGIDFALDRIRTTPNTFDAHRLIAFSSAHQVQDAVVERLFRGFFTEGRDIGDRATLIELAADAGPGREPVRALLESDAGAEEVRREEAEARARNIEAVPCFTIAGRHVLAGAQEPEAFLEAFAASA